MQSSNSQEGEITISSSVFDVLMEQVDLYYQQESCPVRRAKWQKLLDHLEVSQEIYNQLSVTN
ncbi:MAG: hypothetical protein QNJ41_17670 [Xenococcaceae cyanobacterium MO_188.B32]|nr:hypothetical protein [Xenococcaceae cyanobacterium MO_188.B32]